MSALNEVVVHVDEALDEATLHAIEEGIRQESGVVSVGHNPDRSHMIMVVYDSDSTRASTLLHALEQRGLHGQVVGM